MRSYPFHQVVRGKFIAFKGPRDDCQKQDFSVHPTTYIDVFKSKGVKAVIRLNLEEYDKRTFVKAEIAHHDLFFVDCTTPSDDIVHKFLTIAEDPSSGVVAVHCKAGLGRTGTLIALYLMKHYLFTARQAIAWVRICRPGSIIGPQQHYLVQQEKRMHQLGKSCVPGLGITISDESKQQDLSTADELAEMITTGMNYRDGRRMLSGGQSSRDGKRTLSKSVSFNFNTSRDVSNVEIMGSNQVSSLARLSLRKATSDPGLPASSRGSNNGTLRDSKEGKMKDTLRLSSRKGRL